LEISGAAQKGDHEGEDVIRFFKKAKNFLEPIPAAWSNITIVN